MKRFRVIQGGKRDKPDAGSKDLLYRAYSIGDLTRDDAVYFDVRFDWYCLERKSPPLPYEEAIFDYGKLNEPLRSGLEKDVARCFTEDEVSALEALLSEKYGMGLTREAVRAPLKERVLFFEESGKLIYDFLELSEREGYSLPFKVWGYYTLRTAFNSKTRGNGARFLRAALDLLDLGSKVADTQLEKVAKTIHDEERLVVNEL
jgi:hypothetical protein